MEPSLQIIKEELLNAFALGERDFHNMNLQGIDLSNEDLSGINLSGSVLSGANLSGTRLSGADLSKANLEDSSLARAILERSDLSWARLRNADLVGADLSHSIARAANFTGALLIRAQMSDADFLGACFTAANFMAANFESSVFECCDFVEANLSNVNLAGANLSWSNFSDARLNWAQLSWALLEACDLQNANLTGASLRAANLSFASLQGAKLTGADLYFANLNGALIEPQIAGIARVSSCRISPQTFERSEWSKHNLRDWQSAGATLIELDSFPSEVQKFIRSSRSRFVISLRMNISQNEQIAINALIHHVLGAQTNFRILSLTHQDNVCRVAFDSSDKGQSEAFMNAVNEKLWRTQASAFACPLEDKRDCKKSKIDILSILDSISENIVKIDTLVPTAKDDAILVLNAKLESSSEEPSVGEQNDEMTRISWSSIKLTPVTTPNS